MGKQRAINMTVGNPTKLILQLAVPLMLTNIGQQFYGIVDAAVVGRFVGIEAFASLGATDWSYWMILWSVQAIAQGFGILVSQSFGSGNQKDLKKAIAMSVLLAGIFGAILTAASVCGAAPLLRLLRTPQNIIGGAKAYLTTMYAGTLIVMAYNLSAAFLRAVGDGKTPLIAMLVAGACNILLDLLFVAGFRMGIVGAAFATLMSQVLAFAYCFRVILKMKIFRLSRADWQPDGRVIKALLRLGIPLALSNIIVVAGGVIAQGVINTYDYIVIAGCTATNKLHGLLDCSGIGLGAATSTYIGQNWGANRMDRVRQGLRRSVVIGLVIAGSIMTVMILFGRRIVGLFLAADTANSMEALDIAYRYLFVLSIFLLASYLMNVYRYALQGLGDSIAPMISGVFEFGARTATVFTLTAVIGVNGLFFMDGLAWTAAWLYQMVCYYLDLRKIKNKGLAYRHISSQ